MRALWLDFQQKPPGRRRPGWLLLAAGIVGAGLLLILYQDAAGEQETLQQQVSRLRRGGTSLPSGGETGQTAAGQPPARWEALFAGLEAAADDTVTLLGLQPGGKEIQITGEARDLAAAAAYVERLQATRALRNPHLTRTETLLEHPRRPLRFTLAADWQGGPP